MFGRHGLLLALVAGIASSSSATAAEFRDPSGFSFLFPDEWTAVTKENQESVPAEVKQRLRNGSFDLSRINVVVVAPSAVDLAANVSVAILPVSLPINHGSKQELINTLQKRLPARGARIEGLRGEVYRDGVREAIVLDFDSQMQQSSLMLRQRQIYFNGGEKTFVVTFTAAADQFEEVRSQFYMIQTSFRVPPLSAMGFWKLNGAKLLNALLSGTLIVFLLWARRRASRAVEATAPTVRESEQSTTTGSSLD